MVGIRRRGDHHRQERQVTRMSRSGYLQADFLGLAAMAEDADTKHFNTMRHSSTQVLRHNLIDKPVPA